MANTRIAPRVIVLVRDADGFGPAISEALQPRPNSNITRSETSSIELSLEKYGITDCIASVDLVHFVDAHESPQVSILLLPNYETPIAACAVKEVLASVSSQNFSNQATIIIPLIMETLKAEREMMNHTVSEQKVTLYGAEIGPTNEFTQAMIAGTVPPPLSLRIPCETLACFLQMNRVLNFSTVLLIASGGQGQHKRSTHHKLEALCALGQSLANHVGLDFTKDRLRLEQLEKSKAEQEPWRTLYG